MTESKRSQVAQDTHVEIELIDDQGSSEPMEFDLVADSAADFEQGRISVNAPLGKAIRGKFEGAMVDYVKGDIRKIRIVKVKPLVRKVADDAAARRQAVLDEAVRKAERTNVEIFASSYDGKWGDYNTEGMSGTSEDSTTE